MLLFLVPLALFILLSSRFSATGSSSVESVQIDGKNSQIVEKEVMKFGTVRERLETVVTAGLLPDSVLHDFDYAVLSDSVLNSLDSLYSLAKAKEKVKKINDTVGSALRETEKGRSYDYVKSLKEGETFEKSQYVPFVYNVFNQTYFKIPQNYKWDYSEYWKEWEKGNIFYDTSIGQFNGKTLLYDGKPLSQWSMLPVIDSHSGLPSGQNIPQGSVFGEVPLGLRLVYFSFPEQIIYVRDNTASEIFAKIVGVASLFFQPLAILAAAYQGLASYAGASEKLSMNELNETMKKAFNGSNGFFALLHQNDLFYLGDVNDKKSFPFYSMGRCFWFFDRWVRNFPQDKGLISRNSWSVYENGLVHNSANFAALTPERLEQMIKDFANYTKPFGVENMDGHYIVTKFKDWKLGLA